MINAAANLEVAAELPKYMEMYSAVSLGLSSVRRNSSRVKSGGAPPDPAPRTFVASASHQRRKPIGQPAAAAPASCVVADDALLLDEAGAEVG